MEKTIMIGKPQDFYSYYPYDYNIDVAEEYWITILKEEDRLIDNSDRKYRYHCKSLESMSEELTFQERYIDTEEDLITSPGRLESAKTTSGRNRASHRNLLRIWCTHLSAVCGGSAATRLTATNRPEYSHVPGASRWTVPLFQTIRYEK